MSDLNTKTEFLAVYDDHADAVYRRCLFKTSDHEVALDLMQEAFTRTWDYLAEGKEVRNVKAFVFTVANNLIKDHYKKKKSITMADMGNFDPHRIADEVENINDKVQVEEVIRALENLKEADRDILTLNLLDGFGPKEIGKIMDERENTVSVRLHRARARLRSVLKLEDNES
ncbi:MAG: RNA polymerase sigma factor [Candidatus Paceibacterota bacterium]